MVLRVSSLFITRLSLSLCLFLLPPGLISVRVARAPVTALQVLLRSEAKLRVGFLLHNTHCRESIPLPELKKKARLCCVISFRNGIARFQSKLRRVSELRDCNRLGGVRSQFVMLPMTEKSIYTERERLAHQR